MASRQRVLAYCQERAYVFIDVPVMTDSHQGTPGPDDARAEPRPSTEEDWQLATTAWGASGDPSVARGIKLQRGAVLGRYMVLRELGAGGMGVVYAAYDPELDRKVALKLVLPGLMGEKGRTRILREAQALAKLSHRNVVAIYDVGTMDDQVWLAMELVRGKTLREWLREPRGWREVLEVMCEAGRGLAAAHAAGLLHRDFKPENVMVDEKGGVKVMDFGLARARSNEAASIGAEKSMQAPQPPVDTLAMEVTEAGGLIGTPSYMAPEQILGSELTPAMDQFALCVTLWEALYGVRPYGGGTLANKVAKILTGRMQEPVTGRGVPSRLRRACERGLSFEPEKRWPSMEALLEELRRVGAPRRWVALGVVGGLAAVGIGVGQYAEVGFRCDGAEAQLEGVWDDERKEEVEAAIVGTELVYAPGTWERVEPRLDDYATGWTNKHTEVCEATRVTQEQTEDAMTLRMACLRERRMALRAAVDVLIVADAAVVENAVTLVAGLPMLTRCDDVELLERQRQRLPPPEDPVVAQEVEALRERLADIGAEQEAGKYVPALEHVEPVVVRAEALDHAPLLAEAKFRRGSLLESNGRYAEAEQDMKAAYALALEHEHDEVALHSAQMLTAVVGARQARHAEGLVWGDTALPLAEHSGEDLELADSSSQLGSVYARQGNYERAKLHHQRAFQIKESALGAEHPHLTTDLNNLGLLHTRQGDYEQAKLHHERALEITERTLGADHPYAANNLNNLGIVYQQQGDYEQAKLHFQRALQIKEKALGTDHASVANSLYNLGNVFRRQGDLEQARLHFQRALQIWEKALGADHPDMAMGLNDLGIVFESQGEYEQAKLHYQRALKIREKALGPDHSEVAISSNSLGVVFMNQGNLEQAELHFRRALQIMEKALGSDHPDVAVSLINLGDVFERQGNLEQAELHFRRALQIMEKALGADHPEVAYPLQGLAEVALAQQQFESVRAYAERALAIRERSKVAPELVASVRILLAQALWPDRSQRARARRLAEQARDAWAAIGAPGSYENLLTETEAWLAEHQVP